MSLVINNRDICLLLLLSVTVNEKYAGKSCDNKNNIFKLNWQKMRYIRKYKDFQPMYSISGNNEMIVFVFIVLRMLRMYICSGCEQLKEQYCYSMHFLDAKFAFTVKQGEKFPNFIVKTNKLIYYLTCILFYLYLNLCNDLNIC